MIIRFCATFCCDSTELRASQILCYHFFSVKMYPLILLGKATKEHKRTLQNFEKFLLQMDKKSSLELVVGMAKGCRSFKEKKQTTKQAKEEDFSFSRLFC